MAPASNSSRTSWAAAKWAQYLSADVDAQVGLWQNGYGFPTSLRAQADARLREPQGFLALRSDGVVEPHPLDEATVATVARVRHHYIEERPLLGAASG